jgi:hypothetical protein
MHARGSHRCGGSEASEVHVRCAGTRALSIGTRCGSCSSSCCCSPHWVGTFRALKRVASDYLETPNRGHSGRARRVSVWRSRRWPMGAAVVGAVVGTAESRGRWRRRGRRRGDGGGGDGGSGVHHFSPTAACAVLCTNHVRPVVLPFARPVVLSVRFCKVKGK